MGTATKLLLGLAIMALLSSCYSSKRVAYFQDIDKAKSITAYHNYESKIKENDILAIVVSAPNEDVVTPYNTGGIGSHTLYTVDPNGHINFPVLGKIQVKGLTLRELSDMLLAEISKDVKDPVIKVSFNNYKVTILGEVRAPGTYAMPSEKVTILQAIGMAGDLTLGAKRNNVLLIREMDGKYEHIRIDLRKSDILSSPHLYLCQNDVIYVTPTSSRAFSGSSQSTVIPILASLLGLTISIVTLILNNN